MNLDKEPDFIPPYFFGSHLSDRNSLFSGNDGRKFKNSECMDSSGLSSVSSERFSMTSTQAKQYFDLLFSPQTTMESLKQRNQSLEMKLLEESNSEPEIYYKRKQRFKKLEQKGTEQTHLLEEIKSKEFEKYMAMAQFMKIFACIKEEISGIRSDYYSNKVFATIQKTSVENLKKITKILFSMFTKIMEAPLKDETMLKDGHAGKKIDERLIEFLVIPRFLISKDKLLKLISDEEMQDNFKFLVANGCLGHYNNEANKKLPDQSHLKYIRDLISQKDGRQKYKRLCSINHGGRFVKQNGEEAYHSIFFKPLQCLCMIDQKMKKKQKREKFSSFKNQVEKFPNQFILNEQEPQNIFNFLQLNEMDIIDGKSISRRLFSEYEKSLILQEPNLTKSSTRLFQNDTEQKQQVTQSRFKVKKTLSLLHETSKTEVKLRRPLTLDIDNPTKPTFFIVPPGIDGDPCNI